MSRVIPGIQVVKHDGYPDAVNNLAEELSRWKR